MRRSLATFGLIALVLLSAVAPAATAQVNDGSDYTQGAYIEADVTKDVHQLDWSSALTYEADDGSQAQLPGTLNESVNNTYQYQATDLEAAALGEFPRKDESNNSASGLDASEWTASGASVTDTEPAAGVEAIGVSASAAGDSASYSNFSVSSDEPNRYLQLVLDVNSLASGAEVQIEVVDSDGDYKQAIVNGSASMAEDVIATGTGEGYVYQRQLGKMATNTAGDGTFDNIEKVRIEFVGGTADLTITGMNVEKMTTWSFGERKVDTDDDDGLETETVTEHKETGAIAIDDLSTIGDALDEGAIHDLTMPVKFRTSDVGGSDVQVNFTAADGYPSFSDRASLYYRLELPSAYDLSYADAELVAETELPSNRYLAVEYAEGVSDTEFTDISTWSDETSQFDNEGDKVSLDTTIQPGQKIAIHAKYLVTGDERSAIESSGVVGGPIGDSGGGFFSNLPLIGGIAAAIGAVIGRLKGLI
ncbi:hypothetical protein [Haloplanus natans]|uniref:hypothetical protein n=1 Tax=Haloplanus natans TaxID=376171 RepID=UPI000678062E|nr:hypothetical protein [Haloplanus natans]